LWVWGFSNCALGVIEDVNFPPRCRDGNDAQLEVSAVLGTPPYQYSLDGGPNQGNGQFTTTPGMHSIKITDAVGCMKTFDFQVPNAPALSLQSSTAAPTCHNGNNGQLNVTASEGTAPYFYSLDGGPAMASGNFMTTPGAHTITVTDADGCMQTFNLTVPNTPDIIVNLVHTGLLSCFGDADGTATATVNSGGTAPFTYALNGGNAQNSGTFNNLSAGNYTMVITDSRNCSKTETFTIMEPAELTVASTGTDPTCAGFSNGSISITAAGGTPNYTYGIHGDGSATEANSLFDDLPQGEYFPIVKDANGCQATTGRVLTQPSPLVSDTLEVMASSGNDGAIDVETNGGTMPYAYLWSNGETTQDIDQLPPGDFWLVTSDFYNCPSDTLWVTVPLSTHTQELTAFGFRLMGNPVQEDLVIEMPQDFSPADAIQLEVFDTRGKCWKKELINTGSSVIRVSTERFPSGSYVVRISNGEQAWVQQVLVLQFL